MAEQDGWEPPEMKPEALLLVQLGPEAYYRVLQEFVGPFGLACSRREAKTFVAPHQ